MKKHAIIAAFALCALGGSLSAVNAAGPSETTPESLATPIDNAAELPRFQPSIHAEPEGFAEALAQAEPASDATLEEIGSGVASWYGKRFAGRATANGERFNPAELTAAHRTLPFGSKVRVTHAGSGQSVVVRINDRGPFHGGRVIDLSRAAAEQIGIRSAGSGRVELALLAS